MSTNLFIALLNIAQKPGASLSTSLITTRRICRIFGERADSIHLERRAMRRKANKLRHYLPFTASAMAMQLGKESLHCSFQYRNIWRWQCLFLRL